MMTTEGMIQRFDQIVALIGGGTGTVDRIAKELGLSESSTRRYLRLLVEDGEVHIGAIEGVGRESKSVYMLGKGTGEFPQRHPGVPRAKAERKKEEKPVERDPMVAFMFGQYRRAA